MKRFTLLFLALSACTPVPLSDFKIDASSDDPIVLKAQEISVESRVMRFESLPHIEQEIPVSPEDAAKQWVDNRFVADQSGFGKKALIVIEKANMIQREKPSEHWYMVDNISYELTYLISLSFVNAAGETLYTQSVGGTHTSELPKRSSLQEKEKTWEKMISTLLKKIDRKMIADLPEEAR